MLVQIENFIRPSRDLRGILKFHFPTNKLAGYARMSPAGVAFGTKFFALNLMAWSDTEKAKTKNP
jgi:hypothetical protein